MGKYVVRCEVNNGTIQKLFEYTTFLNHPSNQNMKMVLKIPITKKLKTGNVVDVYFESIFDIEYKLQKGEVIRMEPNKINIIKTVLVN